MTKRLDDDTLGQRIDFIDANSARIFERAGHQIGGLQYEAVGAAARLEVIATTSTSLLLKLYLFREMTMTGRRLVEIDP
jgi:hypothetical protein